MMQEAEANRRGVEIMVRFGGVTEHEALDRYATYFIEANSRISATGATISLPFDDLADPCERELPSIDLDRAPGSASCRRRASG